MKGLKLSSTPWSQPSSWSQALTPLTTDLNGRPAAAYLEIGKGVAIITSSMSQCGFPNADFLRNLIQWAKDPARQAAAEVHQASMRKAADGLPDLTVPFLAKAPTIDGRIGADEWSDAAVIPDFVSIKGTMPPQKTICKIGRTRDDLYVQFQCFDDDISRVAKNQTQRDTVLSTDDCVELFLDPSGQRKGAYHFAVNILGTQYGARDNDPSWDRYWVAKTGMIAGGWCVEMRIPFGSLDISAKTPPDKTWAANFDRQYQNRHGAGRFVSGWSLSPGGFDIPQCFGILKGIEVDDVQYSIKPELAIKTPENWVVGNNQVVANIEPVGDRSAHISISCVDLDTGTTLCTSRSHSVRPGQSVQIPVAVPISTEGKHLLQFTAHDAADPEWILGSTPVVHLTTIAPFEVKLLYPAFRNSVQSRDLKKDLWLRGRTNGLQSSHMRARVAITVRGKMIPFWQDMIPIKPEVWFDIKHDISELPVGDYVMTADLVDNASKLLGTRRFDLHVLQPAPMEVTFDYRHACYIDGKPFFPIGLYHVSPVAVDGVNGASKGLGLPPINIEGALKSVKEHGFNCVHHTWMMPREDYLKTDQNLGLYVIPEIGTPDADALSQMVATANKYHNVLMWYGPDEPAGDVLKTAIAAHATYVKCDPHRPVSAACCSPSVFPGAAEADDFIMMDPYCIRSSTLTQISSWVDAGMKASQGRLPVWMVPQAFAESNSAWSEPTCDELRCEAYLSLVHGATGLIWYAYWDGGPYLENPKGRNHWFLPDSKLWDYFPKLNAEIQTLAPVLLEGDSRGSANCDSSIMHSNLWEYNGERYLIAVNPTNAPITCAMSGLKAEKAVVMFENRSLPVDDNKLHDSFKPFEAHVYKL
jgi:hypothetical protein